MALGVGLDGVGWASAFPVPVDRDGFVRRVKTAMPAELGYVERRLEDRLNPDRLMAGVQTVIVTIQGYRVGCPGIGDMGPGSGYVSSFAWSRDYHHTVLPRVQSLAQGISQTWGCKTKAYVDTGPILEKAYGAAGGLGFIGRNGLLITPKFGSFVFLGAILTDGQVAGPKPDFIPNGCNTCTACIRACPTQALGNPGSPDLFRCLAHWTVTAKDPPPDNLPLAGHLYGCDRCQDVCPYNGQIPKANMGDFGPQPALHHPKLQDILSMDDGEFTATFGQTPIIRRGRERVQMIAQILAQNPTRP